MEVDRDWAALSSNERRRPRRYCGPGPSDGTKHLAPSHLARLQHSTTHHTDGLWQSRGQYDGKAGTTLSERTSGGRFKGDGRAVTYKRPLTSASPTPASSVILLLASRKFPVSHAILSNGLPIHPLRRMPTPISTLAALYHL